MATETTDPELEVILWTPSFETGFETIDAQHQQLVQRLNQLAACFGEDPSAAFPEALLVALLDFAEDHFSTEEAIWGRWLGDDTWVMRHRQTHASFIAHVLSLQTEKVWRSAEEVAEDLLHFLTRWLVHHILDDDQRLARMVRAVRGGTSPAEAADLADSQMRGMMSVPIDTLLAINKILSARALEVLREKRRRARAEQMLQASTVAAVALRQQHDMRQLISELAADLMAAATGEIDAAVDRILCRSGTFLDADRAYVFIKDDTGQYMHNTHEWCAPGIEPQREYLQDQLVEATPWWWEQILLQGYVLVPDVARLPAEAASERAVLEPQGILSLCAFPLRNQDQIYGFVGFDAVRKRRDWHEEVIELGCTIGGLIGIALGHGKLHRALVDSEARYRALFESLADTVIVVDTATQSIVDANPQATTLTGRSIEDLRTLHIGQIHPPELAEMTQQHLLASERDERIVMTELAVRHRDGHLIPVEVRSAGHYQAGKQSLVVSLYRDISERKRAEARIRHMAQHDPLTGLPNRAHFGHLIERALESAGSAQTRLALLFMDLDNLKPVNDRLGHAAGDQLLKAAAQRIRSSIRTSDHCARIGGDELVVILKDIRQSADAAAVANKILSAIAAPLSFEGHRLTPSISVGIALYPEDGADAATLSRHADEAMYQAKAAGKNSFSFYRAPDPASLT